MERIISFIISFLLSLNLFVHPMFNPSADPQPDPVSAPVVQYIATEATVPTESAPVYIPVETQPIQVPNIPVQPEYSVTIPAATMPAESIEPNRTPDVGNSVPATSTEPTAPYEPTITTPSETATEPTAPTECCHNWIFIDHPEVGHYVESFSCACGYQFRDVSAYDSHVAQYAGTAEMFTVHGHWGSVAQWVVDTPSWSEKLCSLCGAMG